MTSAPAENLLGLQLEQLQIADNGSNQSVQSDISAHSESPVIEQPSDNSQSKEKKKEKPYINPERFKTGGSQREKLNDEELAERMQRIKAQNERIKQRRLDVVADEEAFRKTEKQERARLAQAREVQERVNIAREQNARRKLDKMQGREWDSGKPTSSDNPTARESTSGHASQPRHESHWRRGGSGGRPGRGRGRGRDGASTLGGQNNDSPRDSGLPFTD
ncbi:hypothetical protein APHAL10511_001373 [Amanita phalloides]|nr:hypothetical protein APHAL10511_001373 [Amanita phalloides]